MSAQLLTPELERTIDLVADGERRAKEIAKLIARMESERKGKTNV